MIEKLDELMERDSDGDNHTRNYFVSALRVLFSGPTVDAQLQKAAAVWLDSVDQFLGLLISLRDLPPGEEYQDDRVVSTLRLLNFLRSVGGRDTMCKLSNQLGFSSSLSLTILTLAARAVCRHPLRPPARRLARPERGLHRGGSDAQAARILVRLEPERLRGPVRVRRARAAPTVALWAEGVALPPDARLPRSVLVPFYTAAQSEAS